MVPAFMSMGILFFCILFAVIVVASMVQGRGLWTRAFEGIATRYGGYFSSAKLTRPPAAAFIYKQGDCRVRCRRKSGIASRITELQITWGNRTPKFEIVPIGFQPKIRALRKTQPIPTGDAEFDSKFVVFEGKKSPGVVGSLLSSGAIWQVYQMTNFMPLASTRVALDKGSLIIQKGDFIKQAQQLDDFVRFALEIYDQMKLTQTEGIEFNDDLVAAVEDVQCPICSCDIEGKMVLCVRCKTPHCLDCWQYNTKCGMYACNEKRFVSVG